MKIFEFADATIVIKHIRTVLIQANDNNKWMLSIVGHECQLRTYFDTENLAREKYQSLLSAMREENENI